MAQPRTFQFIGAAYGNSPVTITASINSTQIFSGPVTTLDQPIASPPSTSNNIVLFTIDNSDLLNTDFAGSLPMTVSVTGGYGITVGQITCNYAVGTVGAANVYGQCYFGNPINSENSEDPRSSVVIGGVAKTPQRPPNGTWVYMISEGETMTHNFNIALGTVSNVVGNISTYTGDYSAFLRS